MNHNRCNLEALVRLVTLGSRNLAYAEETDLIEAVHRALALVVGYDVGDDGILNRQMLCAAAHALLDGIGEGYTSRLNAFKHALDSLVQMPELNGVTPKPQGETKKDSGR